MATYTIGLDFGQAQDYSALVVLEHTEERPPFKHDAVEIRRWPLGTPYPQIVFDVGGMLDTPTLRGAALVVDATGLGRPVIDMFRTANRRPIPVLITAGAHAHYDDDTGYWNVPKKELVGAVQIALQTGALKIARSLQHAQTIAQELTQFQAKITDAANVVTGTWREGQHDDLVLALALWYVPRTNSLIGAFAR